MSMKRSLFLYLSLFVLFSAGCDGGVGGPTGPANAPILDQQSVRVNPPQANPGSIIIFSIDFVGILMIIMSLLGLIFSYDICTREKENGTLKMQLSNSLSRAKILLGKVLGVFITLFPIIVFCYLLSTIIILFSTEIVFTANEWGRIILLFFASLIYLLVFIVFGLFISTRFKSSITSIVVCLFFWVFFVFIIPNLSVYLADSFVTVQSRDNLNAVMEDLRGEFNDKCREYSETLTEPDWHMNWYSSAGADGAAT